jgi:hypothetical protein
MLTQENPPVTTRGGRHAQLFAELQANPAGTWHSIPLDQLGGKTPEIARRTLISCARSRGITIATSIQDGKLFLQIIAATAQKEGV